MRGKQIDERLKELIRFEYATNNNYAETARVFNMPESTVKDIIKKTDNFDDYRRQKVSELIDNAAEFKQQFMERAEQIIEKAVNLAINKIDNEPEKIKVSELSTLIGTMFDKRALSKGEPTGINEDKLNLNIDYNSLPDAALTEIEQAKGHDEILRIVARYKK